MVPVLVVLSSHPAGLGLLEARGSGRPAAVLAPPSPRAEAEPVPVPAHDASPAASRSQGRAQLQWPAPGLITSPFGDGRGHPGIDIDGVTGDPVLAAAPGTVLGAGPAPPGFGGYGTIVAIDHGNGMSTLYAHLSRVDVATGQTVAAGQLIGAIGMTGVATGDHQHFEVRIAHVPVDPMLWLPARPAAAPAAKASAPAPAPSVPSLDKTGLKPPHTV